MRLALNAAYSVLGLAIPSFVGHASACGTSSPMPTGIGWFYIVTAAVFFFAPALIGVALLGWFLLARRSPERQETTSESVTGPLWTDEERELSADVTVGAESDTVADQDLPSP